MSPLDKLCAGPSFPETDLGFEMPESRIDEGLKPNEEQCVNGTTHAEPLACDQVAVATKKSDQAPELYALLDKAGVDSDLVLSVIRSFESGDLNGTALNYASIVIIFRQAYAIDPSFKGEYERVVAVHQKLLQSAALMEASGGNSESAVFLADTMYRLYGKDDPKILDRVMGIYTVAGLTHMLNQEGELHTFSESIDHYRGIVRAYSESTLGGSIINSGRGFIGDDMLFTGKPPLDPSLIIGDCEFVDGATRTIAEINSRRERLISHVEQLLESVHVGDEFTVNLKLASFYAYIGENEKLQSSLKTAREIFRANGAPKGSEANEIALLHRLASSEIDPRQMDIYLKEADALISRLDSADPNRALFKLANLELRHERDLEIMNLNLSGKKITLAEYRESAATNERALIESCGVLLGTSRSSSSEVIAAKIYDSAANIFEIRMEQLGESRDDDHSAAWSEFQKTISEAQRYISSQDERETFARVELAIAIFQVRNGNIQSGISRARHIGDRYPDTLVSEIIVDSGSYLLKAGVVEADGQVTASESILPDLRRVSSALKTLSGKTVELPSMPARLNLLGEYRSVGEELIDATGDISASYRYGISSLSDREALIGAGTFSLNMLFMYFGGVFGTFAEKAVLAAGTYAGRQAALKAASSSVLRRVILNSSVNLAKRQGFAGTALSGMAEASNIATFHSATELMSKALPDRSLGKSEHSFSDGLLDAALFVKIARFAQTLNLSRWMIEGESKAARFGRNSSNAVLGAMGYQLVNHRAEGNFKGYWEDVLKTSAEVIAMHQGNKFFESFFPLESARKLAQRFDRSVVKSWNIGNKLEEERDFDDNGSGGFPLVSPSFAYVGAYPGGTQGALKSKSGLWHPSALMSDSTNSASGPQGASGDGGRNVGPRRRVRLNEEGPPTILDDMSRVAEIAEIWAGNTDRLVAQITEYGSQSFGDGRTRNLQLFLHLTEVGVVCSRNSEGSIGGISLSYRGSRFIDYSLRGIAETEAARIAEARVRTVLDEIIAGNRDGDGRAAPIAAGERLTPIQEILRPYPANTRPLIGSLLPVTQGMAGNPGRVTLTLIRNENSEIVASQNGGSDRASRLGSLTVIRGNRRWEIEVQIGAEVTERSEILVALNRFGSEISRGLSDDIPFRLSETYPNRARSREGTFDVARPNLPASLPGAGLRVLPQEFSRNNLPERIRGEYAQLMGDLGMIVNTADSGRRSPESRGYLRISVYKEEGTLRAVVGTHPREVISFNMRLSFGEFSDDREIAEIKDIRGDARFADFSGFVSELKTRIRKFNKRRHPATIVFPPDWLDAGLAGRNVAILPREAAGVQHRPAVPSGADQVQRLPYLSRPDDQGGPVGRSSAVAGITMIPDAIAIQRTLNGDASDGVIQKSILGLRIGRRRPFAENTRGLFYTMSTPYRLGFGFEKFRNEKMGTYVITLSVLDRSLSRFSIGRNSDGFHIAISRNTDAPRSSNKIQDRLQTISDKQVEMTKEPSGEWTIRNIGQGEVTVVTIKQGDNILDPAQSMMEFLAQDGLNDSKTLHFVGEVQRYRVVINGIVTFDIVLR